MQDFLAIGQNRKLENEKTQNNISEISEFSINHFFILKKNVSPISQSR